MGQREIGRLRQKCFTFGKTLLACGRQFTFTPKVGDAFEMSLATGDSRAKPKCNRKRNPSYLHPESHGDSGMTANLPETNDADEEEQGSDDENDLSVLVVLGDR